jgi:hypothetical protein
MAGLLAVVVAMSLAMAVSIAYVLVLSELRRINANLEQLIKLAVDARSNEPANHEAVPASAPYQPRLSSFGRF